MTNNKSIMSIIAEQVASNLYSILLETIIMLAIAVFAIYEIHETKKEFTLKMETSYAAFSEFSKSQAVKIDNLTNQIEKMNLILSGVLDVAVEDVQQNKEEYYEVIKTKSKKAFSSWLENKKTSNEDNH